MSPWETILLVLAGVVSLFSGLFALKGPGGKGPRLLFLVIAILTAISFGTFPLFAGLRGGSIIRDLLQISAIFLPTLWLLFSLVFARENYHVGLGRWKWWLGLAAAASISLSFVSFFFEPTLFQADARGSLELLVMPLGKWITVFALFAASIVLVNTEGTYRAATGIYRRRLTVPFAVVGIFFAAVIVAASSVVLNGVIEMLYVDICAALSILVFLSISHYLRSYQDKSSGVIVKREAVYSSVGVILIGAYLILVGAVGKGLELIGADTSVFYSIIAAFLVIILFMSFLLSGSLKRRFKRLVDRSVYSGAPVDYHEDMASFAEDISTTLDVSSLVEKLSNLLKEQLGIDRLWLYLEHAHLPAFTRVYPTAEQSGQSIDKESFFVDWIFRHGEAISLDDLTARFESAGESLPVDGLPDVEDVSVCLPLIAKHSIVGMLFLGRKKDRSDFSHQDIQFISAVGNQFALAVLSARLSEELLAARQIESFHKFSTFVMHDLKNSISMLSMLIQNFEANVGKPEFQKSAFVTIQGAVRRMQTVIMKLRKSEFAETQTVSSCNPADIVGNLRTKLGLDGIDQISYSEKIEEVGSINADVEQLTGVMENLLVNAIEAMPQGGDLTVSVYEKDSKITIEVSDTGVGMDPDFVNKRLFKPFETTKKKGLGIGLYQSRDQLERMGGAFKVSSQIGEGTTFRILFPRKDQQAG